MNEKSVRGPLPRPSKIPQDSQPLVVFQAFHDSYRGPYVRWAELYPSSRAHAEDAVHDALLELMKKWSAILAQAEPVAYAWWLVKNRVKDAARSRSRRQKMTDAIFATQALYETTDPIGQLETSMALWEAIDTLPERQHDVFLLRFNLGYSTRDTAHILGITEATVRSTVRAIRRRIAEALDIDFKYALAMDLEDPSFHHSVLADLRERLFFSRSGACSFLAIPWSVISRQRRWVVP